MEAADLLPLLEQLDDNVDDLEEVLKPILESPVSETSKKLPVLDKAKFHVLVTYALESLIFSYLRLHGVNAKEHPVFRELTRVKQYFGKIQALEAEPEQRTMTLDKEAAGRFIKHGLAGNDKLDMQRKEQEAKEKARAQLKAALLAKKAAASETSSKNRTSSSDSESEPGNEEPDSEEAMTAESGQMTRPSEITQSENSPEGKKKKDKNKHETSKATRKRKKRSKEEEQERKKERRQKKMEVRKAAKAK
ncbi:nuclear nucleic acid-binding protein C1D [Aspergillus udagawae]|jgi:exosome complex protein LRP1|uniref:Exosome complex protein n=1 Tax=Aspergillus udagawae TaxID=91492 RepID=A0A8H3NP09_9EURO|nr:nuclear nucleic acid-binding protein C1D [Aspergillus udagawae]GFF37207.1 nuclear nucleic acid-binding protein C1D [Aspergillus udagawae]GFF95143.1 nuclear nucleic acid-binding protein C1D [Aspergillus udagawae]GFG06900.1 nuclear nucleic acid-binding protein C1D [Aspergillus udagawae]GFG21916.1 nuclear nucleic acid-binding protein C1D [Aspergillus udagawae]